MSWEVLFLIYLNYFLPRVELMYVQHTSSIFFLKEKNKKWLHKFEFIWDFFSAKYTGRIHVCKSTADLLTPSPSSLDIPIVLSIG